MDTVLAVAVLATMAIKALLIVAHLRLRHRHRLLRSTLRRVADERNAALWTANQRYGA